MATFLLSKCSFQGCRLEIIMIDSLQSFCFMANCQLVVENLSLAEENPNLVLISHFGHTSAVLLIGD